MRSRRSFPITRALWFFGLCLLPAGTAGAGDADQALNLLQLHAAKIATSSDPWIATADIQALSDGDTATACRLRAQTDVPTDFLFYFSGEVVSPESVEIQLKVASESNEVLGQMEILGSLVSPQMGFQLLRRDLLRSTRLPQVFAFPPAGAKWIVLRFVFPHGGEDLVVSDVKFRGHPGPPISAYAFKEVPAQALRVLAKLGPVVARETALTPEEVSLFRDVKGGRLQKWTLADGLLLAAGVTSPAGRRVYTRKLEALEQEARRSLDKIPDPLARGEALLVWLHARVLRQYRAGHFDLPHALDRHTFNCVSATALYHLLAQSLGLNVRSVEAPDHVFSIIYHGRTHADVETTTAQGFNPARDPEIVQRFTAATGFNYLPDSDRDHRREINDAGLIGIVYLARGAELAQRHKYAQALRAYFCALSLDPDMASAIHNILVLLSGWSLLLALDGKMAEAVALVQTGLAIAPQDQNLNFTHRALCLEQANAALDAGDTGTALAVFQRAARAAPAGGFDTLQAWVFIHPAEALVAQGEWSRALRSVEKGRPLVPQAAQTELDQWRASVYTNWAQDELDRTRFPQAVGVLEEAMRVLPAEKRFRYLLGYVVQAWAESAWRNKNLKSAGSILFTMLRRHPHLPQIKQALAGFARRVSENSLEALFRAEVMIPLENAQALPWGHEKLQILMLVFFDTLAQRHLRHHEWNEAEKIYLRTLDFFPGDETLQTRLMTVWDLRIDEQTLADNWDNALGYANRAAHADLDDQYFEEKVGGLVSWRAEILYARRGRPAAEDWLARAVETYPDNPYVPEAVEDYLQNRLAEIKDDDPQRNFKAAELKERCRVLRVDKYTAQKLEIHQYEELVGKYLARKNWESAIRVYRDALRFYPDVEQVRSTAVDLWDAWIQDCDERGDWDAALKVCTRAGQALPYDLPHFDAAFQDAVERCALDAYQKKGVAASARTLADLIRQYPFKPCLRAGALNHFQSVLEGADAGNLTALENLGLTVVREGTKTLGAYPAGDALTRTLYLRLAAEAGKRGDAKAAGRYYGAAMKKNQAGDE